MNNSAITCHVIIDADDESKNEETKTFPTNFNEINKTDRTQNFHILLIFLLIIIALLIAFSITVI